jgi:hypothetical protein
MPAGGVWRGSALSRRDPATGPRVVRCCRRAGLRLCVRRRPRTAWAPSGGSRSWRIWPAVYAATLAAGAPVGDELDALEARVETAARDPERPRRQPQNRQGGAGPGRPEATFRRQCRSAGDGCSCGWRVTGGGSCNATGQIAFCTGSVRQVSRNGGRLHASPDRDDLGRHDDRSAVLPRGPGVPAALALSRPGRPAFPAAGRRRWSKTQGGACDAPSSVPATPANRGQDWSCAKYMADTRVTWAYAGAAPLPAAARSKPDCHAAPSCGISPGRDMNQVNDKHARAVPGGPHVPALGSRSPGGAKPVPAQKAEPGA